MYLFLYKLGLYIFKFVPIRTFFIFQNELNIVTNVYYSTIVNQILNQHSLFQFKVITSISGVDFIGRFNRFEVVYELLSLQYNLRIRIKVYSEGELINFNTITHINPAANWWEREIWEMFGLIFHGNTDLRRLLTDYGFRGFPLRKDFPLSGFVESNYSFINKRIFLAPIEIAHTYKFQKNYNNWN